MYGVNVEYKTENGNYPAFYAYAEGKKVFAFCDLNTEKFLLPVTETLKNKNCSVTVYTVPEKEPIPTEELCNEIIEKAKGCDLLLAAGSGTLNDINKFAAVNLGVSCATVATAPSMDGYVSGVSALTFGGKKITLNTWTPDWLIIDCDTLAAAPSEMIAAGIGDVAGKYNCLLDWKLAVAKNGESYNEEAVATMLRAVDTCMSNIDKILKGDPEGAKTLIDALITSGYAMVIAGNSRPASGGEHHTSHYLEMDFVRRGERVPLHGLKVALGTMVCIRLYNIILEKQIRFKGCEEIYGEIKKLPKVEEIRDILKKLNAPYRYRDIGVDEPLLRETLLNAYTVRERYTVLTLFKELGLMESVLDELVAEFL